MTPAPERAGSVPGVDKEADSPRDARLCAHCPRREQPHAAAIVRIARRAACCDGNAYGGTLDRDERECATPCRRRPAPRARFRRRRRVICAGLGAVEAGDGNRARCSAGRAASRPFRRLAQALTESGRVCRPGLARVRPRAHSPARDRIRPLDAPATHADPTRRVARSPPTAGVAAALRSAEASAPRLTRAARPRRRHAATSMRPSWLACTPPAFCLKSGARTS